MPSKFKGGLGLRPVHYPMILSQKPQLPEFFEVISENFMDSEGRPREVLRQVRRDYEVFLHGVSLSLATLGPLDWEYLKGLKKLVDDIEPTVVSDHLCWSRIGQHSLHDLLPFPYTQASLQMIEAKVHQVQDYLGRTILLENLSYYLQAPQNEMSEAQFLNELCTRTGCQVLFDINNLYVNSENFKFNAYDFIVELGLHHVGQIHLAGHSRIEKFLFDTHSCEVSLHVLQIYEDILELIKGVPVMIEWDSEIPSYQALEGELRKVHEIWQRFENHKMALEISQQELKA